VTTPSDPLPADLAAAHAMILAQREQLTLAKSEVTAGRLEIERLKLMLAKARREQFGQSSERGKLQVEQLELAIEDLERSRPNRKSRLRSQLQKPPRRGARAIRVGSPEIVVGGSGGDLGANSSRSKNRVSLSSSSRIRPLKLSIKPF
jgi:hypothetical protein